VRTEIGGLETELTIESARSDWTNYYRNVADALHGRAPLAVTPEHVTAENVEHRLYHVGRHEKLPLLLGILQREQPNRTMVFVNTKRAGEWLAERLEDNGLQGKAITGDLDQRVRLRLVRDFKSGDLPILIATDVASRGLHIEDVSHVINYDLPQDAENYVHRVGRTARAGASGKAISLACEEYVESLESIEALTGFKIPVEHVTDEMLVHPRPPRHGRHHGRPRGGPQRDGRGAAPTGARRRARGGARPT